jgi:hypothetical protein
LGDVHFSTFVRRRRGPCLLSAGNSPSVTDVGDDQPTAQDSRHASDESEKGGHDPGG